MRALLAFTLATLTVGASAQDARELAAERAMKKELSGEHPLQALMRSQRAVLKPELRGVHPRVYATAAEIDELKRRAQGSHRAIWQRALGQVRALRVPPAAAPAQERRAQNEVGLGIAEAAFAYRIEGDRKYLDAARRYMDAAVSYPVWGYTNNKPDVDLAAGHLLYGLGWGYDLLYPDLSPDERTRYRDKLARQARKLAAYFAPKPGKTYAYSQNHTFIPIAGLGVAAYALYDEVEDAPRWAALARAIFDRVLATYSTDGYFYEGFEYWIFSTPWLIHWLDAHAHATGEDLYERPGFRAMHKYVSHALRPDGDDAFDFGDQWEGPETRARRGKDYARSHPGGRFGSNYNLLQRLAARFGDREAQGVAQWMEGLGHVNAEEYWSLLWYDPALPAVPIGRQPRWHHFTDHDVVYWRSDWTPEATAVAFKCGPPEGHHATALLKRFPDWRLSTGHAHPDANSFILYARGNVLSGDSGYAGIPLTAHHNTVLVDGRGQGLEGQGHDAWDGVPYDRLDATRILEIEAGPESLRIRGDATGSYLPDTALTRFERRFEYAAKTGVTITDSLEAAKPVAFTSLIHSDTTVKRLDDRRFAIGTAAASLTVRVDQPGLATLAIEPNELRAPGPPGSVEKGERVVRGERLAITSAPTQATTFITRLEIGPP